VVGIDDAIVAVEFSAAKDPASVSAARFTLNHHALLRERSGQSLGAIRQKP
jgi:hypothetical protein